VSNGGMNNEFKKTKDALEPNCRILPESELLYDWRFTANQFVLSTSPLRPTASNLFFD
jgi:hypothetical protein